MLRDEFWKKIEILRREKIKSKLKKKKRIMIREGEDKNGIERVKIEMMVRKLMKLGIGIEERWKSLERKIFKVKMDERKRRLKKEVEIDGGDKRIKKVGEKIKEEIVVKRFDVGEGMNEIGKEDLIGNGGKCIGIEKRVEKKGKLELRWLRERIEKNLGKSKEKKEVEKKIKYLIIGERGRM